MNDELDDDDLALVAKLRALPPEGVEPDWKQLEAAIREEVGDEAPRPWWRNWRWIVPIWALATTAAIALLVTRDHAKPIAPAPMPFVAPIAVTPTPTVERASAVWLDGEPVDIGDGDVELPDAIATEEVDDSFDLHWIDELDDREIESVEQWLSHKRS
jgi:hypothetical protein